ncbi:hypothetical protein CRD_02417 [Raphidiopsis brookii D9]|jgi:hypothetical protein|nr:hypothetical protein CRD_02417 [Raphidiopsis brookii D9]
MIQCPECKSSKINKNGHKKANKIIFVKTVVDNLLIITKPTEDIQKRQEMD